MLGLNRNRPHDKTWQPNFFSNIHTTACMQTSPRFQPPSRLETPPPGHESDLETSYQIMEEHLPGFRSSSALRLWAKSHGDGKLASPIIDRVQLNYCLPGCLGE
ncbi:Uncharacterized protein HZ326_14983 [Fusarium oxysporum f. sp. albedinis]|nr:Uncharacterized protein HZ326_14983 [Fusarium oxysporum f. sp. albedinis]